MAAALEDELDQLVALVPMVKTMEVLQEVVTTLDLNVAPDVAAIERSSPFSTQ